VSVILSTQLCMYMRLILTGFRDRTVSLYSTKIVDKKEILRTVYNNNNVDTVYLFCLAFLMSVNMQLSLSLSFTTCFDLMRPSSGVHPLKEPAALLCRLFFIQFWFF
jgi:hypothetical protein